MFRLYLGRKRVLTRSREARSRRSFICSKISLIFSTGCAFAHSMTYDSTVTPAFFLYPFV